MTMLEVRGCDDGVTRFCRRGFSSVGGSTFWGLVQLLTSCTTFEEVIRLTERGSSSRVDMLVGDICSPPPPHSNRIRSVLSVDTPEPSCTRASRQRFCEVGSPHSARRCSWHPRCCFTDGGDYPEIGLRGDVIAASFGKVAMQREEAHALGPKFLIRYLFALLRHWEECFWLVTLAILDWIPNCMGLNWLAELAADRSASKSMSGNAIGGAFGGKYHRASDVALSLLRMVSNNIGHVACLHAQHHGLRQIVFGGEEQGGS